MNPVNHTNSNPGLGKVSSEILETLLFLILITALPLIDSGKLMNSNQSEKFFFLYFILVFLLFIKAIKILFNKPVSHFYITWVDVLLAIYFVYITCNHFFVAGILGNTMHYFETVGLAIIYVLIRASKRENNYLLILVLLIAGIVQAIYGNLQLYGVYPSHHNLFRITGGFFNPGPYAGYLVSVFPVALAFYLFHGQIKLNINSFKWFHNRFFKVLTWFNRLTKKTKVIKPAEVTLKQFETTSKQFWTAIPKYIAITSIIAILLVLPATRSRASWLAVLISSAMLLFKKYNVKKTLEKLLNTNTKKIGAVILTTIIIGSLSFGLYQFKKGSADGRFLIWKNTAQMMRDKPIFGLGYEKFQTRYMNYQAKHFKQNPESPFADVAGDNNYAFNEFLRIGSETGVVGLLLAMGIIILVFNPNKRNIKTHEGAINFAACSGILAMLVFGFFSYPASILPIKLNFVFLLAVFAGYKKPITVEMPSFFRSNLLVRIALTTFIVALLVIPSPFFNKWHKAHKKWQTAYYTYQMGAYESSLEDYEKALPLLKHNGTFLVNYGKALSLAGKHEEAVEILTKAQEYLSNTIVFTAMGDSYKALGQYAKAEESYYQAWYMIPSRFYPKYLLAKLYDETKQKTKAFETANELLNKKIKIQSTAIKEIKAEMEKIIKNEGIH